MKEKENHEKKKQRRPSLRSLARELNIAPVTVLRALSNTPGVTIELRRRVIALARQRNYSLPVHDKKLIAVIIPDFFFIGYTGLLLTPLMQELSRQNFHGEIIALRDMDILQDHIYAGAISIVWTEGLEKLWPREYVIPLVVINATSNLQQGIYKVSSDERQGMFLGLEEFWSKNRRRLALVTSDWRNNLNARERVEAFQEFCRMKNISDQALLLNRWEFSSEEEVVQELLQHKADAVFFASEGEILQYLFFLKKAGVRIPEDLSLLTLENPVTSSYVDPPLTTLGQNFQKLAENAVQILQKRIRRENSPAKVIVKYKLTRRGSC